MIGEMLSERSGKRIVRRVLSIDPLHVEVTFEDAGKLLGVDSNGMGTYHSTVKADGSLYGEGVGSYITQDGDVVTWKGSGIGTLKKGGNVSYRGIIYFQTASAKLARLNSVGGAFELETDAEGKMHSKMWEWK